VYKQSPKQTEKEKRGDIWGNLAIPSKTLTACYFGLVSSVELTTILLILAILLFSSFF